MNDDSGPTIHVLEIEYDAENDKYDSWKTILFITLNQFLKIKMRCYTKTVMSGRIERIDSLGKSILPVLIQISKIFMYGWNNSDEASETLLFKSVFWKCCRICLVDGLLTELL